METRPSVGRREVPFEEFGEGLLEVMVVPAKVPVVVAVLDVDDVVLDDVAVSLSAGRMDMAAGEFKRCAVDPFVECVLVDTAGGDRSKDLSKCPCPLCVAMARLGSRGNQQSRQQSWKYRGKRTKQGVLGVG
jgi:hypothetical protein